MCLSLQWAELSSPWVLFWQTVHQKGTETSDRRGTGWEERSGLGYRARPHRSWGCPLWRVIVKTGGCLTIPKRKHVPNIVCIILGERNLLSRLCNFQPWGHLVFQCLCEVWTWKAIESYKCRTFPGFFPLVWDTVCFCLSTATQKAIPKCSGELVGLGHSGQPPPQAWVLGCGNWLASFRVLLVAIFLVPTSSGAWSKLLYVKAKGGSVQTS